MSMKYVITLRFLSVQANLDKILSINNSLMINIIFKDINPTIGIKEINKIKISY